MSLTLRNIKGTELTFNELDGNFTYLNDLISNLESLVLQPKSYIGVFDFVSNLTTNITNSNEWRLLISDFQSIYINDFENGKTSITYIGGSKKIFKIEGIASLTSSNNQQIAMAFFLNGDIIPCSQQETVTTSGGKFSALPFHCTVQLQEGDNLEVYVMNKTAANNVTLDNINIIVSEINGIII
jgi:hypothetical protein